MGFFAIIFSIVIILIQTTSLLLNRDAHHWNFSLLKKTINTTFLKDMNEYFKNKNEQRTSLDLLENFPYHANKINATEIVPTNYNRYQNVLNTTIYFFDSSASCKANTACLKVAWQNNENKIPSYCLINMHQRQTIERVLDEFNPHLILLTICIIHCVFCISRLKTNILSQVIVENGLFQNPDQKISMETPGKISTFTSSILLYVLLLVVYIVEGIRSNVKYTSIVISIVLVLACTFFVIYNQRFKDHILFNFYHMLLVSTPTAILTYCIIGTRFWVDVVYHIILLFISAMAFVMAYESNHIVSKKISQLIAIATSTLSLLFAYIQWGGIENWKYIVGFMGSSVLLPFYIYSFFSTGIYDLSETDKTLANLKYLTKISLTVTSAALISLVINIGMFYDTL